MFLVVSHGLDGVSEANPSSICQNQAMLKTPPGQIISNLQCHWLPLNFRGESIKKHWKYEYIHFETASKANASEIKEKRERPHFLHMKSIEIVICFVVMSFFFVWVKQNRWFLDFFRRQWPKNVVQSAFLSVSRPKWLRYIGISLASHPKSLDCRQISITIAPNIMYCRHFCWLVLQKRCTVAIFRCPSLEMLKTDIWIRFG